MVQAQETLGGWGGAGTQPEERGYMGGSQRSAHPGVRGVEQLLGSIQSGRGARGSSRADRTSPRPAQFRWIIGPIFSLSPRLAGQPPRSMARISEAPGARL